MSRRGEPDRGVQFDEYACGGLIEGPGDPELFARIEAQLRGCPIITAAQLQQFVPLGFLQELNATPPGDSSDEQPPA